MKRHGIGMAVAAVLGALTCAMFPSRAVAQSQDRSRGTVSGIVQETDGTPIPGAVVLLTGPFPGTDEQRTNADRAGFFQFSGVRPGTYQMAVELPGLSAPGNVEVTVEPGQRVDTVIALSLFAYEVNVSVVARSAERAELLDPESTSPRRQLTARELTRLPLPAEQALEVLPVFPGVVRGPGGLISIGGNLPTDSAYLFNGADLMDPYSGDYRLRLPLEAVESVDLRTGVYGPAYGEHVGGVVDVSTAAGGDVWDMELASIFPRPWFRDGSIDGVRRFNPRLRISGPIDPGKVWISQSFEYRFERMRVRDTPQERGDHERVEGFESLTQIDWRPNDRDRGRAVLLFFPEGRDFLGLSGLTPDTATATSQGDAAAIVLDHQKRIGERSFVLTTAQFSRAATQVFPTDPLSSGSFRMFPDQNDGTAFQRARWRTHHYQLKSTYTRAIGQEDTRHLVQAGIEVHGLSLDGNVANGPIEVLGTDGRLLRRIEFVNADDLSGSKWELAAFAQDRWRPSQRFWLDFGLRISRDTAADDTRIAPRFGAAWDLAGNGRTLLRASAGLLFRRVYMGEQRWDQLPDRLETDYADDGSATARLLVSRRDAELDSPRALMGTVSLLHRLTDWLALHVAYSERHSRKQIFFERIAGDAVPVAPGESAYSAVTAPGVEPGSLLLSSAGTAKYRDLEFTANLRVGRRDQLFVSYTRSLAEGELNDFTRVASPTPDPIVRPNQNAALRFDTPNRLVIWGTFHLPWQVIASPVIEWRDGFPWSVLDEAQDYVGAAHTERFPTYIAGDIHITKGFRMFDKPFRAGLQLMNFTNRFNPRDVVASNAARRFGQFLNSHSLRVRFRFSASF